MKTKAEKAGVSGLNGAEISRKELLRLHNQVIRRMRKMSAEEGFRSLVEAGIYTPSGKLAKPYGG